MTSAKMVSAVTFLYLLCTVLYFIFLAFRAERLGRLATGAAWTTLGIQTTAILLRWVESYQLGFGRAPLTNMYESLVFFSWCIALLYLLWERNLKSRVIGAFALPFAFAFNAYASLAPGVSAKIDPLIPALQSNWLHAHVITCFLAYAAFALSCAVSIVYLIKLRKKGKREKEGAFFPGLDSLDELIYRTIVVGFPLLTIGIVTGAAWANYAWGAYWSWDPKETWSLITWFVYAIFLHARISRDWRGKRTAILSLIGFVSVMFTYFGVNYLLSGLHSYAS
ncbi:MAG: c-type cytochrome biogenesis protein CcsB [Syntrophaceae bacterium]|nr:c-type cytochrome biogenesis protein CcsB [Syntrophaceae bacterium]